MFNNSKNFTIHGGTYTNVTNLPKQEFPALERLKANASHGAFHNSSERYDLPKCHPHTRLAVIEAIMDWIGIQNSQRSSFIMWLYGPAGAGKSAIAQTIAEMCHELGILAASFFWSRSTPGRNDENRLIATLACQFITVIPQLAPYVEEVVENDRLLFSYNLEAQMESLIIEPLKKVFPFGQQRPEAPPNPKTLPKLIILDGLDECGKPTIQRHILQVISTAVRRFPIPIIFLIASRSEQEIRDGFNSQPLCSCTTRLALDDTYRPNDDIRRFLVDSFDSMKERHPLRPHLPPTWPTANEIETIVRKSSGQFIYATTVIKFVGSPRHRPQERLKILFRIGNTGNHTPFAELDAFYCHIFGTVIEKALPRVLEIFSCIFLLSKSKLKSADMIEDILSYARGDLHLFLSDMHSVVDVPEITDSLREVRVFHASLQDFLMDPTRSGRFYIDEAKARAHLTQCFGHFFLVDPESNSQPLGIHTLEAGRVPDEDIRHFLVKRFRKIKKTWPSGSFPEIWPSAGDIETIVQRSAGQFIYAAAVVKFVNSFCDNPDRRLYNILGIADARDHTPLDELDSLYRHIFGKITETVLPHALEVFSCLCLLSQSKKTLKTIKEILSPSKFEVESILWAFKLDAIVDGLQAEDGHPLTVDASLRDFLLDPSRSAQFYIDEAKARTHLMQCFQRAFLVKSIT